MPLLILETTANLLDQSRTNLLTKLSRIVAETIGKPEQYVMVVVRIRRPVEAPWETAGHLQRELQSPLPLSRPCISQVSLLWMADLASYLGEVGNDTGHSSWDQQAFNQLGPTSETCCAILKNVQEVSKHS